MLLDFIIQIDESRALLTEHARRLGCIELVLFLIKLMAFRNSTNGQKEMLFVEIVEQFLLTDSVYELNLNSQQHRSVHKFNPEEFDIIEVEVHRMIAGNLLPTFDEFIRAEYKKPKTLKSADTKSRRPSIVSDHVCKK